MRWGRAVIGRRSGVHARSLTKKGKTVRPWAVGSIVAASAMSSASSWSLLMPISSRAHCTTDPPSVSAPPTTTLRASTR